LREGNNARRERFVFNEIRIPVVFGTQILFDVEEKDPSDIRFYPGK
jgi:hypothetical protein